MVRMSVSDEAVKEAARILYSGGLVVFPTETVYGIGAVWNRPDAVKGLKEAKGRPDGKPLQVLAADIEMARKVGAVFPTGRVLCVARHFWPGPLTMVLPAAEGGTIGVRIPDHDFVLALCRYLGGPLIASSANISGQPSPMNVEAADVFGDKVSLFVDGGPIPKSLASTVVDVTGAEPCLLRQGSITIKEILDLWKLGE